MKNRQLADALKDVKDMDADTAAKAVQGMTKMLKAKLGIPVEVVDMKRVAFLVDVTFRFDAKHIPKLFSKPGDGDRL